MKKSLIGGLLLCVIMVTVNAQPGMIQNIELQRNYQQSELLKASESLALVFKNYPLQQTLLMRRLFIEEQLQNHRLFSDPVFRHKSEDNYGLLRPPMAWELLSVLHIPRLYSFFTAADLGGYGDNQPPYEPSNPYPSDGATNVPMDNLVLMWQGGDPDPGDTVEYDIYFGTSPDPPFLVGGLPAAYYLVTGTIPGTQYYWRVVARDNWDAETEGPVWTFWTLPNYPPYPPVNPIPADGATNVDRFANLSWQCNDPNPGDILTFDIYFGTTSPPPLVETDYSSFTYSPGEMDGLTTYYWSITARDNWGAETEGPIWSFTTIEGDNNPPYTPSNPAPSNGAENVSVNTTLSWTGGDPDPGDTVTYDLYLGTDPTPPMHERNMPDAQYTPPQPLDFSTTYYWYIVARDSFSAETSGPLWYFTTASDHPTPTPEPCIEYSVTLDMGADYFCPGDSVFLNAQLCNPEQTQYLPLWIILEIEGMFWFAPSWSDSVDYFISNPIPSGWSVFNVIPEFVWPNVEGSFYGAMFWGAMTTPEYQIMGLYDMYTFAWGPC